MMANGVSHATGLCAYNEAEGQHHHIVLQFYRPVMVASSHFEHGFHEAKEKWNSCAIKYPGVRLRFYHTVVFSCICNAIVHTHE